MDLGALLHPLILQAVGTAQGAATAVVSGTVDPTGGAVLSSSTTMARTMRDAVVGAWNGDVTRPAPRWVPLVAVVVFGIVGAALTLVMLHINPLENIAAVLGFGVSSGIAAHGTHALGQQVAASEPTTSASILPNLEPSTPAIAAAIEESVQPNGSTVPPPDASAVQVPLQVGTATTGTTAPAAPLVVTPVPETPQSTPPAVSEHPAPVSPDQPQPLNNSEGVDISGIFDPAWQQAGIPRVLLLAAVLAESRLDPKAERWGRRTVEAQEALAVLGQL